MKNIVLCTAGHIDHGKTNMIKILTGVDTDTLKEEKERGITIDLGIASLPNSLGMNISIVDLPGHEKFIKNMIAGASAAKFVLFVIACDDGIMPQTVEHKDILKLLKIEKGIIILTKKDLVSTEKLKKLKEEIKNSFTDKYFDAFPIVAVSNKEKETYKVLYDKILEEVSKLFEEKVVDTNFFRMDIDKFYSPKGVGTVVTGTAQGDISKGEILTIYPQQIQVKVKELQSHSKSYDIIENNQRCALNISNIGVKDIKRGNFVSKNSHLIKSKIIDVLFTPLKERVYPKNNTKILLNVGTAEYKGKIKYLNDLENGNIYFQLLMEKDIFVTFEETGILRSLNTSEILGGISVLNTNGKKTKKNDKLYILKLEMLSKKSNINIDDYILEKKEFISLDKSTKNLIENKSLGENIVVLEKTGLVVHKENLSQLNRDIENYILKFHRSNPLKKGVSLTVLKSVYFRKETIKEFNDIIFSLSKEIFKVEPPYISLLNFEIKLSKEDKIVKDKILILLKKNKFIGMKIDKIEENFFSKNEFKSVFNYLYLEEYIIKIGDNFVLSGFYKEALKRLENFFIKSETITLSEYRDLLETNRDTALTYLEYFDKVGITKKIENVRILRKNIKGDFV